MSVLFCYSSVTKGLKRSSIKLQKLIHPQFWRPEVLSDYQSQKSRGRFLVSSSFWWHQVSSAGDSIPQSASALRAAPLLGLNIPLSSLLGRLQGSGSICAIQDKRPSQDPALTHHRYVLLCCVGNSHRSQESGDILYLCILPFF